MAKKTPSKPDLLRWSKHVATADVQDPLGTSLRGATRLAGRLLYCITSITPRARYFSFIPWCVHDFQQHEEGKPYAKGLKDAISLREHALTLGCVAHHEGEACPGGGLVGSRKAIGWFKSHSASEVSINRVKFVKNPAVDAYFNSLVNLGVFVTDDEMPDVDEDPEEVVRTFDDIELSDLGLALANSYNSSVGTLKAVKQISSRQRGCSLQSLRNLGERGGLCELAEQTSPDRSVLRDIFFCRILLDGESHPIRRRSLLLLLELCRQLNDGDWLFDHGTFADAVYFGELAWEDQREAVHLPDVLLDIATRWRMYYFHYYMAVALEGLFSWLVTRLGTAGLAGEAIEDLIECLDTEPLRQELQELLSMDDSGVFGRSTPEQLVSRFGVASGKLTEGVSRTLDERIRPSSPIAESVLTEALRSGDHTHSSTGLALSLVLLAVNLGRYTRWEKSNYGDWLTSVATDPDLDLIPPILLAGLRRRLGDWWNTPWHDIAQFVLSRYVVQTHQTMSYEKSASGDRCLLQSHGSTVCSTGDYDKIGVVNARYHSAVQILTDLGLLEESSEDGIPIITNEGREFLSDELAHEASE